nr:glucosidase 2 subunit beta-like [Leptinotarsa decemlineata]
MRGQFFVMRLYTIFVAGTMFANFFKIPKLMNSFLIIIVLVCEILSSEVPRPRGVSLSRASLYPPDKDFTCFDGSKTIPFTQVNDDYCDCQDASDEPGTSACPHGIFHCTNAGHRPENIPSNRVNDGICDCCDGTDEYASDKSCQNNCIELGRSAREAAQRRSELIKVGKQLRAELSQKGIQLKQEKQLKINELQKNKEEAEKLKAEREALKKEVEEQENAALEYYRQLEEEIKKKKAEEEEKKNRAEAIETFNEFDSNQDGLVDISELRTRESFDKDRNGEVSEEEAKYFLNLQDSVDLETFVGECWKSIKPYLMMETGVFKPPITEPKQSTSEAEDLQDGEHEQEEAHEEDDEEEEEEEEEPQEPEQVEEPQEQPTTVPYDEETQKLVEKANAARSEYQEAERQVRDIENEIKDIQSYLQKDFGQEEEYATLEGQCFDYEDLEYIYKLCPFDRTTQQPKSGAADTRLGSWGHWSGPESNKYEQMTYEKGQSCWNGPTRSTIVRLSCGGENKVTSVSEPNRCEYLFDFVTPAACYEAPADASEDLHDEL